MAITRLSEQGQGLLTVNQGLPVVAEQRVQPADRLEGSGLPSRSPTARSWRVPPPHRCRAPAEPETQATSFDLVILVRLAKIGPGGAPVTEPGSRRPTGGLISRES